MINIYDNNFELLDTNLSIVEASNFSKVKGSSIKLALHENVMMDSFYFVNTSNIKSTAMFLAKAIMHRIENGADDDVIIGSLQNGLDVLNKNKGRVK